MLKGRQQQLRWDVVDKLVAFQVLPFKRFQSSNFEQYNYMLLYHFAL